MSLLGGEAVPDRGFRNVFLSPKALGVEVADLVLRIRIAVFGGAHVPADRAAEDALDTESVFVEHADVVLRGGVAFLGQGEPDAVGLVVIAPLIRLGGGVHLSPRDGHGGE